MGDQRSDRERVARNETLFRQVNERVREASQAFATFDPSPVDFVCECGSQECTEPIALTLGEYEAIRAQPTRFFVLAEHVIPEVERVVSTHGSYLVVEKLPGESVVAEETDPRV